jgi:serine/threonine protein kinase
MSPEMIKGEPYSFDCGIWSLGVVAYELATLELPFTARTPHLLRKAIMSGKYKEMGADIDAELKTLIGKMLVVV